MDKVARNRWANMDQGERQALFYKDQQMCWELDPAWVLDFAELVALTRAQETWMKLAVLELNPERYEALRKKHGVKTSS